MSTETNKETVRRWVASAWSKGDFSMLAGSYTPNYTLNDPSLPQPIVSPAALQQFINTFRNAMPDLHMTVDELVAEGDKVSWRFTVTGTHTGELMGIPPTNTAVKITGLILSRFEDGKWAYDYAHWDTLGMLQQMGVVPRMG